jgi:DNA/RNA-binding domain of Phe-tRNA-synthetase-like protein
MIGIDPAFDGVACLGILEMDDVLVQESPADLKAMIASLAEECAAKYKGQAPGDIPTIRQVRTILHRAGLDPTRYRASSESLLRRVVKGKGLYFINSVVDLINYFSLKTLWPMGLYDLDQLKPPISWRVGRDGESYEGIGRERLSLTHFPVLVDSEGAFGSPISDSMRTRVTEACTRILWITFAPPASIIPLEEFSSTMSRFNSGVVKMATQI